MPDVIQNEEDEVSRRMAKPSLPNNFDELSDEEKASWARARRSLRRRQGTRSGAEADDIEGIGGGRRDDEGGIRCGRGELALGRCGRRGVRGVQVRNVQVRNRPVYPFCDVTIYMLLNSSPLRHFASCPQGLSTKTSFRQGTRRPGNLSIYS